jgi:hypothetical protein
MMARSVADYLIHFESCGSAKPAFEACQFTADLGPETKVPSDDPAVAVEAARAEGFAEGFAAAQDDYAAGIEQERLAFEARIAAERERWTQQESVKIAENLKEAICAAESRIAGSVVRVLRPFIIESLRGKMVDLLSESISVLLGGKEPLIKISGPHDLLAALREKQPAMCRTIEFISSDSIDVQMVAGETMIETQIAAWVARIESLWRLSDG